MQDSQWRMTNNELSGSWRRNWSLVIDHLRKTFLRQTAFTLHSLEDLDHVRYFPGGKKVTERKKTRAWSFLGR